LLRPHFRRFPADEYQRLRSPILHLGGATHIVRRTIQELEQDLDARTFFRIHRSTIVNLERVRGLELQESGEYEVVLDSNIRLKLSRRFRKRLQDRLGGR
jgi:two-component system LytT family response regulator